MYFLYGTRGYYMCYLNALEGNNKEYVYMFRGNAKRYLMAENSAQFSSTGTCKLGTVFPDTLRIPGIAQSSADGYILLVRHKGLVEYSFDGQEIWRLVEKE